jgi:hypothetical protein
VTVSPMPPFMDDQLEPFQSAMRFTNVPLTALKLPPTTRSPFAIVASAFTVPFTPLVPTPDQLVPFHRARDCTNCPSA